MTSIEITFYLSRLCRRARIPGSVRGFSGFCLIRGIAGVVVAVSVPVNTIRDICWSFVWHRFSSQEVVGPVERDNWLTKDVSF
jgi:hypothetical protein